MKKFFKPMAAILTLVMFSSISIYSALAESFPDVELNNPYRDAIEYLHFQNILTGDDQEGTFRPTDSLNRAEFAAILSRINGVEPDISVYNNCFPDVTSQWYAPYICYAKNNGWVKGYADGEKAGYYGPGDNLLNAETIVVMARMIKWDTGLGDSWYGPAWAYAISHNIIADQVYSDNISRELMAEVVFRTAVVNHFNLQSYTEEKGFQYMDKNNLVTDSFAEKKDQSASDETVKLLQLFELQFDPVVVQDDAKAVELFKIYGKSGLGSGEVLLNSVRFSMVDEQSTRNIARLYLKDENTGDILFDENFKLKNLELPLEFNFSEPLSFSESAINTYTLYADMDYEEEQMIQFQISGVEAFDANAKVDAVFPLMGRRVTRTLDFYNSADDSGKRSYCASFDEEFNLPFASEKLALDTEKATPVEGAGPVVLDEDAHDVKPIDQGSEGICAAAAVYSSLRWFEDLWDIDLVENGKNGLDKLTEKFYGSAITTDVKQYKEIEKHLESMNSCIDVEYDTQAGLNVACDELLEYKNKQCDIPLVFRCEKVNPETGEVITGEGAEEWGHVVDLVDVSLNSSDDNQCSITYANSWKDSVNPGADLDGLGAGRYEKANYNDDSENFDVLAPWGDQYKCKLDAAIYICVDKDKC